MIRKLPSATIDIISPRVNYVEASREKVWSSHRGLYHLFITGNTFSLKEENFDNPALEALSYTLYQQLTQRPIVPDENSNAYLIPHEMGYVMPVNLDILAKMNMNEIQERLGSGQWAKILEDINDLGEYTNAVIQHEDMQDYLRH